MGDSLRGCAAGTNHQCVRALHGSGTHADGLTGARQRPAADAGSAPRSQMYVKRAVAQTEPQVPRRLKHDWGKHRPRSQIDPDQYAVFAKRLDSIHNRQTGHHRHDHACSLPPPLPDRCSDGNRRLADRHPADGECAGRCLAQTADDRPESQGAGVHRRCRHHQASKLQARQRMLELPVLHCRHRSLCTVPWLQRIAKGMVFSLGQKASLSGVNRFIVDLIATA